MMVVKVKEGYWMIRTIRSGKVIERSQFYVGERRPRQGRRKGSSTLSKKDNNMNQACRRLARVINCNFGKGDIFMTLTYDEKHLPGSIEDANKQCTLFFRRLSRVLGEITPRYIWSTSESDTSEEGKVRLHHHIVISSEGFDLKWQGNKLISCSIGGKLIEKIWKNGLVNIEPLREQDDYASIAAYIVRQSKVEADDKKWHSSRNLKKPVIESEKISGTPHELRPPCGATVLEMSSFDIENGAHYIRYIRKAKDNDVREVQTPEGTVYENAVGDKRIPEAESRVRRASSWRQQRRRRR